LLPTCILLPIRFNFLPQNYKNNLTTVISNFLFNLKVLETKKTNAHIKKTDMKHLPFAFVCFRYYLIEPQACGIHYYHAMAKAGIYNEWNFIFFTITFLLLTVLGVPLRVGMLRGALRTIPGVYPEELRDISHAIFRLWPFFADDLF
jgi:hypothetical protein